MKKILSIVGARPQFIKTALLPWELRKNFQEIVVHTGQHYDLNMSDIFFKELKLPAIDYNLGVGSGSHGVQTAKMLSRVEEVLLKEKPDMVLIYGDTNSTVAGALAASKLHIPVAHVEAGLRSYNRKMPEEINRIVSDHISELLFCPTRNAADILKKEGIKKGIHFVGDVTHDLQKTILLDQKALKTVLDKFGLSHKEYIFATIHRPENTDNPEKLTSIIKAFANAPRPVVWPVHPRTKKYLKSFLLYQSLKKHPNIKLLDPISYRDTIFLENSSQAVITDSGGVQKEAYLARVPCITLRNETEWVETVAAGWNKVVGTDAQKIIKLSKKFPSPKNHPNFLGDGTAYLKITEIIKRALA